MIYGTQNRMCAIERNHEPKENQSSLRARSNTLRPSRSDPPPISCVRCALTVVRPTLRMTPSHLRHPLRTSSRDSNSRQDQRKDRRTGHLRHHRFSVAAVGTCLVVEGLAGSTFAAGEARIGLGEGRNPGLEEASRSSEGALGCSSPAGRRHRPAEGMRVVVRPVRCC
jgi:hypothetical protein